MAKKCPPGVFCVENYTLGVLALIIIGLLIWMWNNNQGGSKNGARNSLDYISNRLDNLNSSLLGNINNNNNNSNNDLYARTDSVWSSGESVLLNPYTAPNRDDRPFTRNRMPDQRGTRLGVPINVRTQGVESDYRQIGILTRITGEETILPLMGRPLIYGRDTWNFYTMSDKNNMVKLPITFKNKNCSGEYGCDNISNGDTVYVEGYNDAFKVTMYENNTMRYIPYI